MTFGVPRELSSDGGPEFKSDMTAKFLKNWNVSHRVSSAYYPRSNGRAEVAVKTAKRLLRSNILPSGSLDCDKFLRAMLQLRNTPDPDCNLSPAQIIFGRPLRDSLSFADRLVKFSGSNVRKTWRDAWTAKEDALRVRFTKSTERLNEHSRQLPPLQVGDKCLIQNQTGNHPKKWDRSGVVTEVLPFDKYTVKVDGSWRVTQRNRRFLKAYTPAATSIDYGNHAYPYPVAGPTVKTTVNPDITVHEPKHVVTEDDKAPHIHNDHSGYILDEPKPESVPLAMRRLMNYNKPGLKEAHVPETRSRRRSLQ